MRGFRRGNKFNANKHEAVVGGQDCDFDSMAEHRYAEWLESERRAGRIKAWQHHPPSVEVYDPLTETLLCRMNPDFFVKRANGDVQMHEVKGVPTPLWRLKRHLLETFTNIDYVVVAASHGVCRTGIGPPVLFDNVPSRKRRRKGRK